MNAERQVIELTVPADPSMMLIVRLTTSGALARSGLSVDAVEDTKMAAEEACNCLIRSSGCNRLRVSYWLEDSHFWLHAESIACACCPPAQGIDAEEIDVIRCVLLSMVDEADLTFDEGRLRAIDVRKRLPS